MPLHIVKNQKQVLDIYSSNRTCGNMKTLNLFGLARLATSNGVSVKSEEILGCDRYILERGAKIEDVLAAWALLACMLALTTICFAIEIFSKTLHFGFCTKQGRIAYYSKRGCKNCGSVLN